NRLEVVAREAAIGRKSFSEDQEIPAPLRPLVAVHGEESADIRQAVLLGRHRTAVGQTEHLAGDLARREAAVPFFALLDEPGVLGEAACVQEQRLPVAITQR